MHEIALKFCIHILLEFVAKGHILKVIMSSDSGLVPNKQESIF